MNTPQDGMTELHHWSGIDLPFMFMAVTSRLTGDYPLLRYEVLQHSSPAISVDCHFGSKQVGFTLWPSGEAEMTSEMDVDGGWIAYYTICSQVDLDRFVADIETRLAH